MLNDIYNYYINPLNFKVVLYFLTWLALMPIIWAMIKDLFKLIIKKFGQK